MEVSLSYYRLKQGDKSAFRYLQEQYLDILLLYIDEFVKGPHLYDIAYKVFSEMWLERENIEIPNTAEDPNAVLNYLFDRAKAHGLEYLKSKEEFEKANELLKNDENLRIYAVAKAKIIARQISIKKSKDKY